MKQTKLIFLSLVCLLAISCSGGDDEPPTPSFDAIGKWEMTYYRNSSTSSFIGQRDGTYFLFSSDGSFTFFYSGWGAINSTQTGTYEVVGEGCLKLISSEGEKATIYITGLDESNEAVFSVDGLLFTGTYKFRRL